MFNDLFTNPGFMPHIHCYLDRPLLVWTMFATDLLIGLSYVAISLTLWSIAKKTKIQFGLVVVCFGAFILACGLTHFIEVLTLWQPDYWVAAFVKFITAVASVGTTIYLLKLRTPIVKIAESVQLSETRRLELERLNKGLEFRFQKVADATDLGIWYCDLPFDRLVWNDQTKAHFFMKPEQDVFITDFYERMHPDDREPTRLAIEKSIALRQPYLVEYRTVNLENPSEMKWIKASGWTAYDESGKPISFDGITTDITEQKYRESALHQAISARDDFLSIASHELRTPITSMKLQTQMIARELARNNSTALSPERLSRFALQADTGLARMDRLVEDMLDISRIQGGKLSLQKETTELVSFIRAVVDKFEQQLAAAKINVSFESSVGDDTVLIDRFRIEQVITNLVTNAIRYAPNSRLSFRFETRDHEVVTSVQDGGPGISKENRERIFERFERLVSANDISGLGLGLFIVKQIVQAHEGRIYVEDGEPCGAKFVIELPVNNADQ